MTDEQLNDKVSQARLSVSRREISFCLTNKMSKLSAVQCIDIKKMPFSERLALKLTKIGNEEEEIMSLERPKLMDSLAKCMHKGKDKPPPAITITYL